MSSAFSQQEIWYARMHTLNQCYGATQLVNVQSNSEFASHMLNRDVWREETVKNIIKVGFVLYQV